MGCCCTKPLKPILLPGRSLTGLSDSGQESIVGNWRKWGPGDVVTESLVPSSPEVIQKEFLMKSVVQPRRFQAKYTRAHWLLMVAYDKMQEQRGS